MLVHFVQELGTVPRLVRFAGQHHFVLALVLVFVPEFIDFEHVVIWGLNLRTCQWGIWSACQIAGIVWLASFVWSRRYCWATSRTKSLNRCCFLRRHHLVGTSRATFLYRFLSGSFLSPLLVVSHPFLVCRCKQDRCFIISVRLIRPSFCWLLPRHDLLLKHLDWVTF